MVVQRNGGCSQPQIWSPGTKSYEESEFRVKYDPTRPHYGVLMGWKNRNWFLVISMNARELTGIQNACWRGGRCLYRNYSSMVKYGPAHFGFSLQGCAVPAVPVSLSHFWANLCISGDLFFDGCFNHNLCVYVDSSRVLRVKFHGRSEYFILKLAARLKFQLWA